MTSPCCFAGMSSLNLKPGLVRIGRCCPSLRLMLRRWELSLGQIDRAVNCTTLRRPHLGALLFYADDGKPIYAGRVGTGMPDKVPADLRRRLEPLARKTSPHSEIAGRTSPTPTRGRQPRAASWRDEQKLVIALFQNN